MSNQSERDPFRALDAENHTEIYTAFIAGAILEDEDREALKIKRGFTDEIINILKFKSARQANVSLILELQERFGIDKCLSAGILELSPKGDLRPAYQLIHPNIIIPFFNDKSEVFYLRPHKFGLKDMGIQIYAPFKKLTDTVVIAESEFKAAASLVFGVPAFGLPGIHSFAVNNFERLVNFVKGFPLIRKLVIMFDNEIKDNPALENYKPDVMKQWDTQFRAAQMCRMLQESLPEITCLIATLPAEWMEKGKIDIDGALAQGRTPAEFRKVIDRALTYKEYPKTVPYPGNKVVHKRLTQHFFQSPIVKENGGYYVKKEVKRKDEGVGYVLKKIAGWQMVIKKVVVEGTKYVRHIVFISEDGTVSRVHKCHPETVKLTEFKAWINSCGGFVFHGTQEDLDNILELEYNEASGREVRRPQEIGLLRNEARPVWLFQNCLIKEDTGAILTPDDEGIIWDGLEGFQARSIRESLTDDATESTGKIPSINLDPNIKFGMTELRDVVEKMEATLHNPGVKLAVGWAVACLFSEEIFKKFSCFPILFISGKRESGKTTLGQWIMSLLGLHEISADPISSTTRAGMARNLSWYSSLGYWLDEYRNDKKIKALDGYLRNIYQKQASSKGTLGAGIRSESVNAGLILSGEESPEDNALLSRCMPIHLAKGTRGVSFYDEIEKLRSQNLLSRLMSEVLKRKRDLLPGVLENIQGAKERMIQKGVGERIAFNFACCSVPYYKVFIDHDIEKCRSFMSWVVDEACKSEKEKESEHMLSIFMEDLVTIRENLENHFSVYSVPNALKGRRQIALHFRSFYSEWTDHYRRKGNEQFKAATMLEYIKEEPYYIADDKHKRIGPEKKGTRCLILSLDEEDNPPPGLLSLADGSIALNDEPGDSASTVSSSLPF